MANAAWRNRADAPRVEAMIVEEAERVGLDPAGVLDLVNITAPGAVSDWYQPPEAVVREVRAEMRRIALDPRSQPYLRDPHALMPSPVEVFAAYTAADPERRPSDAAAIARRFPEQFEIGKRKAAEDMQEREAVAARQERDAARRLEQRLRLDHAIAGEQRLLARLESTGEHDWNGIGRPPGPVTPADLRRVRDRIADLTRQRAALDAEAP